jgi:cell division septal protein FtsQ
MWGSRATSRRTKHQAGLHTASVLRVSAAGTLRRRKSIFLLKIALAFVIAAAGLASAGILAWQGARSISRYLFFQNDIFRLRNFKIVCDGEIVTPKHIFEYLELSSCSNIFAFNMAGSREMLLKNVPRIKSAEFARRLPGELIITIRERLPVARLQMNSYFLTIDRDGYILGTSAGSKNLPVISGHELSGLRPGIRLEERKITKALDVLRACDTTPVGNYVRIKNIDVGKPDALEIELAEGEKGRFSWQGMDQESAASRGNMENKLNRLADSLRSAAARGKKIAFIDMTVENNFPAQEY